MPLLTGVRFFTTVISILVLVLGGYLLWSWYAGDLAPDASGALVRSRPVWRLWAGVALLGWSFLGRWVLVPLLAGRDERPIPADAGDGRVMTSPTGSSIHVERHGPAGAPPIIFIHGWGMDSTFWRYARRDLADRFRLILWDLPGLGRSKAANRDAISLSAFAVDLGAVLDAAGGRPVVVGHSIGGMVIQTLMRDRPEAEAQVAGLVLLNTTFTNPLNTMVLGGLARALQRPVLEPAAWLTTWLGPAVWIAKWQSYLSGATHLALRLGFGRYATRSQLAQVALLATRNNPAVLARGDLAMFHWDAAGAMARVRRPTLVVGGDKDVVTKLEASRVIADETPRAVLQVVQDANHMGPLDRAEVYNQLIADFAFSLQAAAERDMPSAPPPSSAREAQGRPGEPRDGSGPPAFH